MVRLVLRDRQHPTATSKMATRASANATIDLIEAGWAAGSLRKCLQVGGSGDRVASRDNVLTASHGDLGCTSCGLLTPANYARLVLRPVGWCKSRPRPRG